MVTNNYLVKEYEKRIADTLIEGGLSKEDAAKALVILDGIIYQELAAELIENMPAEKKEAFDNQIDEHQNPQQIIAALGIDEKELTLRYIHKLEEYLNKAQTQLPAIKEKLVTP